MLYGSNFNTRHLFTNCLTFAHKLTLKAPTLYFRNDHHHHDHHENHRRCQDSSMVRFLHIDSMVSGWVLLSAKPSLRVRRVASFLQPQAYESRGVVTSIGRTWTLLDKQSAYIKQSSLKSY